MPAAALDEAVGSRTVRLDPGSELKAIHHSLLVVYVLITVHLGGHLGGLSEDVQEE